MSSSLTPLCVIALFLLSACASRPPVEAFQTQLYQGAYDDVWLATLKTVSDYPIKVTNRDTGKIQSEQVNGPYNEMLFTPIEPVELPERFRFSLKFALAMIGTDLKRPIVRVRVEKELEKFHDFYTGWLAYPTDGLEERLLLYRIGHVLKMHQLLSREEAALQKIKEPDKETPPTDSRPPASETPKADTSPPKETIAGPAEQ